jgi:hypothetical protein
MAPLAAPIVSGSVSAGGAFVTIHEDGTVAFWPAGASRPATEHPLPARPTTQLAVHPAGDVAVLAEDGVLYRVTRHEPPVVIRKGLVGPISFDSTGAYLAAGLASREQVVFEWGTGTAVARFTSDRQALQVFFGDKPQALFVLDRDGIGLWDAARGVLNRRYDCVDCQLVRAALGDRRLHAIGAGARLVTFDVDGQDAKTQILGEDRLTHLSVDAVTGAAVVSEAGGRVRFLRPEQPDEGLTVAVSNLGWALIDSAGRFDGTVRARHGVLWANEDYAFELSNFTRSHYEPALLGKWLGTIGSGLLTDPRSIAEGVIKPPTLALTARRSDKGLARVTVHQVDAGGGLGTVHLYHQGLAVAAARRLSSKDFRRKGRDSRKEVYELRLLPGDNVITARTEDGEGVLSPPRSLSVEHEVSADRPRLHLLAVGIDAYRREELTLNFAAADALALRDRLDALGRPLYRDVESVTVLNHDADRHAILEAMAKLEAVDPQDAVVIYLAGHGEVLRGRFHFMGSAVSYPYRLEEMQDTGLAFEELAEYIARLQARQVLLLIDACKSGDALGRLQTDDRDRRALQVFSHTLGVHMIAATAKGQLAMELKELGHGVFTYTLLKGLNGAADSTPRDGRLTAAELAAYADSEVPTLSSAYALQPQWPTVYIHGFDFSLAQIGGADAAIP